MWYVTVRYGIDVRARSLGGTSTVLVLVRYEVCFVFVAPNGKIVQEMKAPALLSSGHVIGIDC